MTQPIKWIKEPEYREIVSKEEILRDIKTNLISLLNDYKGRGIENEAAYIEEVNKMFTGGVVPSYKDWTVLVNVLKELSEVKEVGEMYQSFIEDVSDSLGVSDLIEIRNFIEYITTLPPVAPKLKLTVTGISSYGLRIHNVRASFVNSIAVSNTSNSAKVHWNYAKVEQSPVAHIELIDSNSEDIEKYTLTFRAGDCIKTYEYTGLEMDEKGKVNLSLPVDIKDAYSSDKQNFKMDVFVEVIDKRGNKSSAKDNFIMPVSAAIAREFSQVQIGYKRGSQSSINTMHTYSKGNINEYPETYNWTVPKTTGVYTFYVRGYYTGVGWSSWVESPNYSLRFHTSPPPPPPPKPPAPKPEPKPGAKPGPFKAVGTPAHTQVLVMWGISANADYYIATCSGVSSVRVGPRSYMFLFNSLENRKNYNFSVTAYNAYGSYTSSFTMGYFLDNPDLHTPVIRPYPANAPILSARVFGTSVIISWERVTHANEYRIGISESWPKTKTTGTSYTYTGLTKGQTYTFNVDALNVKGVNQFRKSSSITVTV